MSAITIRNIPEEVHDALRKLAVERRQSVESLAREALSDLAGGGRKGGIDFEKLIRRRAALGWDDKNWPAWTEDMDDPAFSRRVLGLED